MPDNTASRPGGRRWPATQRTIVLQFDSVEDAERWDREGQPLPIPPGFTVTVSQRMED